MWMQIIETMYAQQVMLNKINTLMDLQRMKHWYIDENYKSQLNYKRTEALIQYVGIVMCFISF